MGLSSRTVSDTNECRVHMNGHTWQTYHPVLLRHGADSFGSLCGMTPSIAVLRCYVRELGVQLCRLSIVRFDALSAVGTKSVLVERVDVYGIADGVCSTEICKVSP